MDQFVPADWTWSYNNMGDAFAPPCAEDDGLVELLWSNSDAVTQSQPPPAPAQEHDQAAPWFQYSGRTSGLDTAGCGNSASPWPRGGKADGAMSYNDASTTVASTPTRPRASGGAARSSTGKRKQREATRSPSGVIWDVESESAPLPSTGKRRRTAQVHNLSERRRRDRINQKMKALQELVPHCNKTDKASMLDEAINYLKSLQLKVQLMWTVGGGMAHVMSPASGAHQYMQRNRITAARSRMPSFRT